MRCSAQMICGLLLLGSCASLGAQQLTEAQRSAIKSACRGDYQKVCASVPPGTKDSLQCLVQHSAEVSAGCRDALAPAASSSTAAATAPAASAAAPAAAPAASGGQPLSARQEAHLLRSQCGSDFQKYCSNVQVGGGRGVSCLRAHQAELTPACRSALPSAASP
jgi:cysteine rich repeat protein